MFSVRVKIFPEEETIFTSWIFFLIFLSAIIETFTFLGLPDKTANDAATFIFWGKYLIASNTLPSKTTIYLFDFKTFLYNLGYFLK